MESKKINVLDLNRDSILFRVLGLSFAACICLVSFSFTSFKTTFTIDTPIPPIIDVIDIPVVDIEKKKEQKPEPNLENKNTPSSSSFQISPKDQGEAKLKPDDHSDDLTQIPGYPGSDDPEPIITTIVFEPGELIDIPVNFRGGEEALQNMINENMIYPPDQARLGNEADLWIIFTVESDGSISKIKVEGSNEQDFIDEATRIIKLTEGHWIPAQYMKRNCRSTIKIPFEFILE